MKANVILFALLLAALGCTGVIAAPDPTGKPAQAFTYLLTNLTDAQTASNNLAKQSSDFLAQGGTSAGQLSAMQDNYGKMHHGSYEAVRALVAGIPELAEYDGILEAGTVPVDFHGIDGRPGTDKRLETPGGIFINVLELALWDQDDHLVLHGNSYPRAELIRSSSHEINLELRLLLTAASSWKATPENCRSALATSILLVPAYFDEWQQSQYGDPPSGLYKSTNRLEDLKQFLNGCKILFDSFRNEPADAKNAGAIAADLSSLNDLADLTQQRAAVGQFSPTNADEPGGEAQRIVSDLHDKLQGPTTK